MSAREAVWHVSQLRSDLKLEEALKAKDWSKAQMKTLMKRLRDQTPASCTPPDRPLVRAKRHVASSLERLCQVIPGLHHTTDGCKWGLFPESEGVSKDLSPRWAELQPSLHTTLSEEWLLAAWTCQSRKNQLKKKIQILILGGKCSHQNGLHAHKHGISN